MIPLLLAGGFSAIFFGATGGAYYYFALRPQRLYAQALQCQNRGDVPGALALLAKLYHDYPENLAGAWRYAGLLFDSGKLGPARVVLETLVRQQLGEKPSVLEVRLLLARACEKLQDFPAALAEYDTLIAVAPVKTEYVMARGLLRRSLQQWAAALDDFNLVGRERPNAEEVLWCRAEALLALARPAEAKPALRKLLEVKRNHGGALVALGRLLLDEGDVRGALEPLQAAVKEAGQLEPCLLLARAWRTLDEPLRGVNLLEEKVPLFADRQQQALLKHELALGYDRLGDRHKAQVCMREVYAVQPDLPGVKEYLQEDLTALRDDDVIDFFMKLPTAQFERLARIIVAQLGYRVVRAKASSFEALDILAEQVKDSGTTTAVFSFRRWLRNIAELPLRELHRQVLDEHAQHGFFVAPGQFTTGAMRDSLSLRVELIDRVRLVQLLREQQLRPLPPEWLPGQDKT